MTYIPPLPKPGQTKQKRKYLDDDGVFRFPNGREVCCLTLKKGMDEYLRRKRVAWEKQIVVIDKRTIHICPICKQRLNWEEATVDHIKPRGMGAGSRDDRQENIQATHGICNQAKGSKRIDPDFLEAI